MSASIFTAGALIICGALALLRWRQIRLYPIGVGMSVDSPDKRYRAYVTTFEDRSFFGQRSSFYRLELEDLINEATLATFESDRFRENEANAITSTCRVLWTTDSSRVRIVSGAQEMWKKEIKKAAEPGATDNPDDAQRLREDH